MKKVINLIRSILPAKKKKVSKDDVESVMNQLTTQLIEETVGDNGVLTLEFQKLMEGYDKNVNPLSPEEAQEIVHTMMRLAIAHRKCLTERIAASAEVGALYERYYSKVNTVTTSAVYAYDKMLEAERRREEFEYYDEMLAKIREKAYSEEFRPKLFQRKTRHSPDILKEIDNFGEAH